LKFLNATLVQIVSDVYKKHNKENISLGQWLIASNWDTMWSAVNREHVTYTQGWPDCRIVRACHINSGKLRGDQIVELSRIEIVYSQIYQAYKKNIPGSLLRTAQKKKRSMSKTDGIVRLYSQIFQAYKNIPGSLLRTAQKKRSMSKQMELWDRVFTNISGVQKHPRNAEVENGTKKA
jgi:hypothetical protein